MEHLLFSVNATLPIFLVMAVGWCLRRFHLMDGSFVDRLNTINYKITLPILLFTDMAGADFFAVWDTKFVLFCFFATLLSFFAILAIALMFLQLITPHPSLTLFQSFEVPAQSFASSGGTVPTSADYR